MKSGRLQIILKVALAFSAYIMLIRLFKDIKVYLDGWTGYGLLSYLIAYATAIVPILAGVRWIVRKGHAWGALGLRGHVFRAWFWALVFASPMFLGGLALYPFPARVQADQLLAGTLIAGFMEELVYRAFLFGMLFYHARLGFVPSVLVNAIPFALGHWQPELGFAGNIPVLLVTCAAGGFFAWLYVEWERNIWLPVALHALMNLSWSLFDMGGNAAGGALPNLLRAGTIALAIALTLWYKQRLQQGPGVNRKNLLIQKESASGAVT